MSTEPNVAVTMGGLFTDSLRSVWPIQFVIKGTRDISPERGRDVRLTHDDKLS